MTEPSHGYTEEERARDLAQLRALTRKLHRQQRAVEATSAERLEVLRRLRSAGTTYPELAAAMDSTYSAVQRLLAKLDTDTEGLGS
ncbi:hypothetical protein [Mycobacteroides abscessus]|uniref:hypothetical protein n=1 Tax=Mycobacteroides abscessus TaxID=36809 RepID=UPI000C258112|nr:hypothetical protein [Mycobacteroides abscessus]